MAHFLLQGHVLDILRDWPADFFNCCVTSPPYWGLRDYKTEPQVWGGGRECRHEWGSLQPRNSTPRRQIPHGDGRPVETDAYANSRIEVPTTKVSGAGAYCVECGAWKGHLGGEPTPEMYVSHLVEIFREVKRVLRTDGTLWLVLGDSYARDARKGQHKPGDLGKQAYIYDRGGGRASACLDLKAHLERVGGNGLKPKDLVGVPWRVAFALQADGWYLRSDVIWHKCLSGGTVVYARTQKGEMPTTVKDLTRLDPKTVQLWDGDKWNQVIQWSSVFGDPPGCLSGLPLRVKN